MAGPPPPAGGVALAAAGGTTTYRTVEGTDLQSRYPPALEGLRNTAARVVALTLVLFTGWLAADVALRGRGRDHQGVALVSAGVVVGALALAWAVVSLAGPSPQGGAYRAAVDSLFWIGWVTAAAGIAWMVGGFGGAGDHGEAVWGLFLVVAGLVMIPLLGFAVLGLWLCCSAAATGASAGRAGGRRATAAGPTGGPGPSAPGRPARCGARPGA